ncbi:MAG: hypothetical protein WCA95_14235 [Opitutaceae bacterium]
MPDGEGDWPDETDESSFLSDAAARGETPAPARDRNAAPVVGEKLPALDDLVARVPAPVLGLLDDLFRAKFTTVRRYSPGDSAAGQGAGTSN